MNSVKLTTGVIANVNLLHNSMMCRLLNSFVTEAVNGLVSI